MVGRNTDMNRTTHIFVDYENVHEIDLDLIANKPVKVTIILGEKHKKVAWEMVQQIIKYPGQIEVIEAGRSGRNALDFVLAYQLGVEATKYSDHSFHVVSRDTGFDRLIEFMNKNHVKAQRDESFRAAFSAPTPDPSSRGDRLRLITERLTRNKKARPARKKTLLSQINAYFGKSLSAAEAEQIVKGLVTNKVIELSPRGAVVYKI